MVVRMFPWLFFLSLLREGAGVGEDDDQSDGDREARSLMEEMATGCPQQCLCLSEIQVSLHQVVSILHGSSAGSV